MKNDAPESSAFVIRESSRARASEREREVLLTIKKCLKLLKVGKERQREKPGPGNP
jgi:hypothetical protein